MATATLHGQNQTYTTPVSTTVLPVPGPWGVRMGCPPRRPSSGLPGGSGETSNILQTPLKCSLAQPALLLRSSCLQNRHCTSFVQAGVQQGETSCLPARLFWLPGHAWTPLLPSKKPSTSIKPHTSPSPAPRARYLHAAWLEPVPRQEFVPAAAGLVPSPGASLLVHRTRLDGVLFCPRQRGLARGSGSFLGEQAESWGVAETMSPWRLGIARVQSGSGSGSLWQSPRHADPSRHRPLPTARGYGVSKCCLCCGKMGPKKAQLERTADRGKARQSPPLPACPSPHPILRPHTDHKPPTRGCTSDIYN